MDFRFGPSSKMTIVNPNVKGGGEENVQFSITPELEFKEELKMKNQLDLELDNLEWKDPSGRELLRPQPNGHPIFLAQGGNLSENMGDGHVQIYRYWRDTFGVESGYAGALNSDVSYVNSMGEYDPKIPGKGYMYPATKKKPEGRLRVWFEALFMGHYERNIGAEATDGLEPIFNRKLEGEEPSEDQTPLYALSTWMSKQLVSWKRLVSEKNIKGLEADSKDGDVKFREEFLEFYDSNSDRILKDIGAYAASINDTSKTLRVIRRALLMWDAKNIPFVDLLRMDGKNAYNVLFNGHGDNAELAEAPQRHVGGIYLGTQDYLHVVNYSSAGIPVFDPAQIHEFKINFDGFVPVPLTSPVPVNLSTLSGLQEHQR